MIFVPPTFCLENRIKRKKKKKQTCIEFMIVKAFDEYVATIYAECYSFKAFKFKGN